jgi:hypothetical protein
MTEKSPPSLAVWVDGAALPDDEARAFWQRFSAWMEAHRGDLAGFAALEGFASVHPGVEGGRPVLRVSNNEQQRPYAAVSAGQSGETANHPHRMSAFGRRTPLPASDRVAQATGSGGGSGDRHDHRRRDRSRTRTSKK